MIKAKCETCDKEFESDDEALEHMMATVPDEPGGESHRVMPQDPQ